MKATLQNWKKKIRKKYLVFLIFVLLLLELVLFYEYRQRQELNKDENEVGQTQEVTPIPSPPFIPFSPSPQVSPQASASPTVQKQKVFFTGSVFVQPISKNASYVQDNRIGTLRPSQEAYSMPIYRITSTVPLVKVISQYGGRTENWPIPTTAVPASGSDHHMAVLDESKQMIYEMWNASWQNGSISAGGMKNFSLNGTGISVPANQRVTASGFAVSAGMVVREDFVTSGGKLDPSASIDHALTISLPSGFIQRSAFTAPAVNGEADSSAIGDIPLGAQFALPATLDIDTLNVHPFTKALLKAAQKYGMYVNDKNGAGTYNGKAVATVRVEPGLLKSLYGQSSDQLSSLIQNQVADVIAKYGLYRIIK